MDSIVFSRGNIGGMELKNRVIMLAMHNGFAEDGFISERSIEFYRQRAIGGAAAIVCVSAVSEIGCAKDMYLISDDKYIEGHKKLAEVLNEYGSHLIVQLFHTGRNNTVENLDGRNPVAPSCVPSPIYRTTPDELTTQQVYEVIEDFANAAKRCKEAGVSAVEISCSAGYILTQFLSETTNKRDDEFGGSEQNRMKMPLLTIRAVRKAVGDDYPVILRISGSQMIKGGYGIDFMQSFCSIVDKEGLVDAIDVTGGWHEAPVPQISYHVPKGGFAFLADAIKQCVNVPVIACNRINNLETAEKILNKGMADFVGCARQFLADPYFVEKVQNNKPYNICQGCNNCIENVLKNSPTKCAFNPQCGKEYLEVKRRKIATAKKVLVIGGGPAGLMAAKKSAERGYKTTICTDEPVLGGQLNLAAVPVGKQDLSLFVENIKYELEELGVDIKTNFAVTPEFAVNFEPYFVVIAVGSKPIMPNIKGIDSQNVYTFKDVITAERETLEKLKKGKTVIIGGGSVGIETAFHLAASSVTDMSSIEFIKNYIDESIPSVYNNSRITVLEMAKRVGADFGGIRWIVMKEMRDFKINTITEAKVKEICPGYILAEKGGEEIKVEADNVVIAVGSEPVHESISEALENEKISFAKIGDADSVGKAIDALESADELFRRVYLA